MTTPALIRPQVGLRLSCGEPPTDGRDYPKKLDYIRPKPGALGQYAEAAAAFTREYGDRPRVVDVIFVSDSIGEVLDVRPLVFGTSGLKAMGRENLALADPVAFGDRIRAFDWDLVTFPDDQPEPGAYTVQGREDKVVTKLGLKVVGTLRVCIPKVTGLMMICEISTTSARTMANWRNGLELASRITNGVLVGIPFKLLLRPTRGRYWDEKEKKRKVTEYFEWCIESQHSIEELYEIAAERRVAIGNGAATRLALPPVRHDDLDPAGLLPTDEGRIAEAAEVPRVDVQQFEEEPVEEAEAEVVEEHPAGLDSAEASLFQPPPSVRERA